MAIPDQTEAVPGAEMITGAGVGAVLEAALGAVGERLSSWQPREVHRRRDHVSVVLEVWSDADPGGREVVAHVSRRAVPEGAAQVRVGSATVHVWPLVADPYLPGLASASSAQRVGELLEGLGVPATGVTLRRRSYRPARRAVVEVTLAAGTRHASVLFLKVLGGRDGDDVERRTRAVVTPHRALRAAGLPVPAVVGVAEAQGIVALTAVGGTTLHQVIGDASQPLPSPDPIVALTTRLAGVPLDTRADPRRFAAATRHVARLVEVVPDLAPTIEATAAAADTAGGPTGTVHGDLHDGQILLADGQVTGLLDVDGAGHGLLTHDAGRLIAYADAGRERAGPAGTRAREFAGTLFGAYARLLPADDLRRAVAGAWLSLATNPLRTPRDDWRDRVRARVAAANDWLP